MSSAPDAARIAEHLRASPLFEGLPPAAITELSGICRVERVLRGHAIVEEGTIGESMYVILKGRVRVEKKTPSNDRYTVTLLTEEKNDFFGELALLESDPRSATVTAEAETELIVIDRARFLAFGDATPTAGLLVTRRIASRLSTRLRRASDDLITLFAALVHEVEERI